MKRTIVTIVAMLIGSILFLSISGCNSKNSDIVVTVNGEAIYEYQLENVMKQSIDNSISREDLLENSINQLVVVQYGKKVGISIDDNYFDDYINRYKSGYPEYFAKGIDVYGEEEFIDGLRYHLIYQMTREKVISDNFSDIEISENILTLYIKEKGLRIELSKENYDLVKDKYISEKQEELFDEWVAEQRSNSEIEYFE